MMSRYRLVYSAFGEDIRSSAALQARVKAYGRNTSNAPCGMLTCDLTVSLGAVQRALASDRKKGIVGYGHNGALIYYVSVVLLTISPLFC